MLRKEIFTFWLLSCGLWPVATFGKDYRATLISGYMNVPVHQADGSYDEELRPVHLEDLEVVVSLPTRAWGKNKKVTVTVAIKGPSGSNELYQFPASWELTNLEGEYYKSTHYVDLWETLSFFPTRYEDRTQVTITRKGNQQLKTIRLQRFYHPSVTTCSCLARVRTPCPVMDLILEELEGA